MAKEVGQTDFVMMTDISEDALMDNLTQRYKAEHIYTYIGEVVVSVNPYKRIAGLDGAQKMAEYKNRQMYEVPPHIYSLSNNLYDAMLQNKENQCVIISGESGAGKTEASKILMQYLAAVSKTSSDVDRVKNQLLDSNPILEAFGNAKTVRNDNSSRFGKYMEIQFHVDGSAVGGRITNYLLEKGRVVTRAKGERSFHIFYNVIFGHPNLKELQLQSDPKKYRYLSLSECDKVDSINDKSDYDTVVHALGTLGFTDEQKQSMFKIIAGILHLGNLEFKEDNSGKAPSSTITNADVVDVVASLFDVPPAKLKKALTSRTITSGGRGSVYNIPLNKNDAEFTRDALSKATYSRLFDFIVATLNKALDRSEQARLLVGVLDIYGFEIFENNSFEQFCINLCNEKLQQVFIELTLKREQEEYEKEGISWEPVKYFNNKVICELIEGSSAKKMSITAIMDDCTSLAESTDALLLSKLDGQFGKHEHYVSYGVTKDKSLPKDGFRLKHYAGDVDYQIVGFLDKNRDQLYMDLQQIMNISTNTVIQTMFPEVADSKKRPISASMHFKNALGVLMGTLMSTQAHYIRCIKPNENKAPGELNLERVRHQVRYLGLLENVRVRRAGFAYRRDYNHFLWRYKVICPDIWPHCNPGKDACATLMKFCGIADEEYRLGKTKIFIRKPQTLFLLEEKRHEAVPAPITRSQGAFRGWMAQQDQRRTAAATTLQTRIRGKYQQMLWKTLKSTITLQLKLRGLVTMKLIREIANHFDGIQNEPKLGADKSWPQGSKLTAHALSIFKRAHFTWRQYTIRSRVSGATEEFVKKKIFLMDTFAQKKSSWAVAAKWGGDNLGSAAPGPKYPTEVSKALASPKVGDKKILYSDLCTLCNGKMKSEKACFVLTDNHVLFFDAKKFKLGKFPKVAMNITDIKTVCLTTGPDCFVVLQSSTAEDVMVHLANGSEERYSQMISFLVDGLNAKGAKLPNVVVNDSLKVNLTRGKKPGVDLDVVVSSDTANPKLPAGEVLFAKAKKPKNTVNATYNPPA